MGSFIVKQPNGLYCRFSTVVDCPTHYNLTKEEYLDFRAEQAREEAENVLKHHLYPFEEIKERFIPSNMSKKEFEELIKLMST